MRAQITIRTVRSPALLLAAAFVLWSAAPAYAQEPQISLVSSSVTSEFPAGFRFKAEVSGENEITSIAVRFRIGTATTGVYDYLESETGELAGSELFWRTNTSARYIPPGTIITYNFEILDLDGKRLDTEPEEFLYEDIRFEWNEISREAVTIAYHGPVKARAEKILDAMILTLDHMGPLLGADTEAPIRVTMYNNVKEMLEALPPGSATIRRELITEGQAFTNIGTLLVLGGGRLARGTASHELTHILTHRAGDSPLGRVPSWLDEGLAEYGNVDRGYSYDIALEFAVAVGRLLPITSMRILPGEPEDVIIFYGQASDLVRMMVRRYGPLKMKELMATLKSGKTMDRALEEVYGFDRLALENQWRDIIGAPAYLPLATRGALPTPIPRRELVPFSLTPHVVLGEAREETPTPTLEPEPTEIPTPEPTATPAPKPAPAPTRVPQPAPAEVFVEREPTPPAEPEPIGITGEGGESEVGGGACSAPRQAGTRAMDMSGFALVVGLVWLAFRRRLRL